MEFRIGTRGSKLALWQAEWVREKLGAAGHQAVIVPIETRGDQILDVSISKIGSKGVFTEEIEQHLEKGTIDLAVHSAKDMQSVLDPGFDLIAYSRRERENDVFLSKSSITLNEKVRVGTSSTRRVAFLKHFYPDIEVVAVRGNLQTRLRKMEEGHCEGLLLAYAGVYRMGYLEYIREILSLEMFTPAVGQGSIAIEIFETLGKDKVKVLKETLNHNPTEIRIQAERAFLRTLEGGCSIPVFGLAELEGSEIRITGGIISLDGKKIIRDSISGAPHQAESLGVTLGERILEGGGRELLARIRASMN